MFQHYFRYLFQRLIQTQLSIKNTLKKIEELHRIIKLNEFLRAMNSVYYWKYIDANIEKIFVKPYKKFHKTQRLVYKI